jgi:hypothetical protein
LCDLIHRCQITQGKAIIQQIISKTLYFTITAPERLHRVRLVDKQPKLGGTGRGECSQKGI